MSDFLRWLTKNEQMNEQITRFFAWTLIHLLFAQKTYERIPNPVYIQ